MQCKANCGRESDWKLDPLDELCRECLQASQVAFKETLLESKNIRGANESPTD